MLCGALVNEIIENMSALSIEIKILFKNKIQIKIGDLLETGMQQNQNCLIKFYLLILEKVEFWLF